MGRFGNNTRIMGLQSRSAQRAIPESSIGHYGAIYRSFGSKWRLEAYRDVGLLDSLYPQQGSDT